jgi:hypothetical protein
MISRIKPLEISIFHRNEKILQRLFFYLKKHWF